MTFLKRLVFGGSGGSFVQPEYWDAPVWFGGMSADRERVETDFEGLVESVYRKSGPVFSVMAVRQLVFSEARFLWREPDGDGGGWSDLFDSPDLDLLRTPWPGGTTGELLARMDQDASLAGNSWWTTVDDLGRFGAAATGPGRRLSRLVPSRVEIVIDSATHDPTAPDAKPVGIWYRTSAFSAGGVLLLPNEYAHFSPIPDPGARFRGMSWLTPILEDIGADQEASRHKRQFFKRGAQLQHAITFVKDTQPAQIAEFRKRFAADYAGSNNAYKTLVLTGGADIKAIAADLKQIDFTNVTSAGETRIAAAGGVPPILAGFSQGLESSTYSNYGQARRRFADGTARPWWRMAAATLDRVVPQPRSRPKASLWYDDRDIAFCREDQRDASEIQGREAETIRTLVDAGYTPDSVVAAIRQNDWRLLEHSGAYSVQLQPPGATPLADGSAA